MDSRPRRRKPKAIKKGHRIRMSTGSILMPLPRKSSERTLKSDSGCCELGIMTVVRSSSPAWVWKWDCLPWAVTSP